LRLYLGVDLKIQISDILTEDEKNSFGSDREGEKRQSEFGCLLMPGGDRQKTVVGGSIVVIFSIIFLFCSILFCFCGGCFC